MGSDIRKWFMKQHGKGNGAASSGGEAASDSQKPGEKEKQDDRKRRKTSKYFSAPSEEAVGKSKQSENTEVEKTTTKRKSRVLKIESDDDEDFVAPIAKKTPTKPKSEKKMKIEEESDEDEEEIGGKTASIQSKGRGRGSTGRGSAAAAPAGRGRGFGRGGFMNFGERKDPPHKGEKEVPEGAPDCLAGLTFVISGTLDSLEREEAEDLIKRHGGRVTGSVSKKTNFLLADEDIGGRKSSKAKDLGTSFLTEDGLFEMIRKSKSAKTSIQEESTKKSPNKSPKNLVKTQPKHSPSEIETKDQTVKSFSKVAPKSSVPSASPVKRKVKANDAIQVTWTEKYKPKVPNDIIGNQSLVKQLHDWLAQWDEQFLHTSQKGKGRKKSDAGSKKAVLLSGSPGIGKTTSAKLVSKMLGLQAIEVNASDNRGKADAKIFKGIGGCMANSIKELVSNEALTVGKDWSKHQKSVLIMDEVDGMSAGDRGGVADLIASIKVSKIPIICICNDRYSQKLKSLVNYCLLLNFRKPTKQQMAKRLSQIAVAEGIQANDIALEELADRVNGDMRMAINQLQYMSLSHSIINYDDVRARLLNSAKDEDISPFTAVDKLFGFNGGKLRMDERIDLSMSDPDLVPLIIQENYINYRPIRAGKDDNGVKRMNILARTAESVGDGDIINVQIRRYRQWQLSQSSSVASCIIPAALMHGHRETLEQGERNYNRFGGWLGKNSTKGKNLRLLEDVHVHFLASQQSSLDREALRVDYFPLLMKQLTKPLRTMPKEEAVQSVVELMDCYSLNLEDYDSIMELSKFQGHPSPLEGVLPAVKSALTRAYKEDRAGRVIRSADMIVLPGVKKPPKKLVAAMLEPAVEETVDPAELSGEEDLTSEPEDEDGDGEDGEVTKLRADLKSNKSRGIEIDLELKGGPARDKPAGAKSRGSDSVVKPGRGRGSRGRKRM
ncbi:replication factor C1 [Wolffia australiana]